MAQYFDPSKSKVPEARADSNVRRCVDTQQVNSPVTLETFDRERMGIAAKE